MSRDPIALRRAVLAAARELGFELAGIAPAQALPELQAFPAWIASGRAGEMRYLERKAPRADAPYARENILHVFPWARSVVCCGLVYNTAQPKSTAPAPPGRGWISRYAWGDDYHEVLLAKLRRLAEHLRAAAGAAAGEEAGEDRVYVDTGPIVERVYARHAGLGWIGKNTCLIDQHHGSQFFLGTLVTSLLIAADSAPEDRCGSCTRCLEACPTQALQPYQMDARRCIAYLTIELRGAVPEALRPAVGRHVLGCDICQDVCPWNRRAPVTDLAAFQPRPGLVNPDLEELAAMDETAYRERFRASAVKRAKWAGLRRNLALAMGNSRQARFRPRLQAWSESDDAVLREHARWALRQLEPSDANP
ncbi:MAG TPA: tRNA epoxyqueuosine(34) reductase QueG [Terriglobales bacterium]|nr:tRNA epoxyqueuosine(34) reductase QueG [Terriglobales bacterium]